MLPSDKSDSFRNQIRALGETFPEDWEDITTILDQLASAEKPPIVPACEELLESFARGAAFITFSYGIDGVSIEIAKYARALDKLFASIGESSIHVIGEHFEAKADPLAVGQLRAEPRTWCNGA